MDEFELRDKLENERKDIKTFDDLVSFLQNVKNTCNCGYGEAPRAIAQAALATAWFFASDFGITGFQAGFVCTDFIRDWLLPSNKCGFRIVDFDNMLYPQYDYKFEKTLHPRTFESMQKEAKERISERGDAHPEVIAHWESIANGNVPFGYTLKED